MEEESVFTLHESRRRVLLENWKRLTANCPAREADKIYEELSGLYSSPHRIYHNLSHIDSLLDLAGSFEQRIQNYDVVRFAIWFHDAIYETSRKDNEDRSADFAEQSLNLLGISADICAIVRAMILATKTHSAAELSEDGKLFLDLDLSILGSDQTIYDKYRRAIRREYWWVPGPIYKRERRKVLEGFLRRERIFFTAGVFASRESQARSNIERELTFL